MRKHVAGRYLVNSLLEGNTVKEMMQTGLPGTSKKIALGRMYCLMSMKNIYAE